MKILIVYDTYYGNTQKVAEIIGENISAESVAILKAEALNQEHVDSADLVIVGGPTRAFNTTPNVKKAIKSCDFKGKKFWVFDTRSNIEDVDNKFLLKMIKRFGYAAEKIEKKLLKKGGIKIHDYSYYFVKDIEGPLYEDVTDKVKEDLSKLAI